MGTVLVLLKGIGLSEMDQIVILKLVWMNFSLDISIFKGEVTNSEDI